MAVSEATLLAKISALEKRVNDLAAKVKADEAILAPLYAPSANVAFLGQIVGKLQHQTTSNNSIDGSAGSLSATDRTSINGLVNAVNGLQTHLQDKGFRVRQLGHAGAG